MTGEGSSEPGNADIFPDKYQRMEERDGYESVGLNGPYGDERELGQIMQDKRVAEAELDVHDHDDESRRLPKRSRYNVHPSPAGRSFDHTAPEQSAAGRSHHGYSSEDEPMTDQTDVDLAEDESDNEDDPQKLIELVTRDDIRRTIEEKFEHFLLKYVNPANIELIDKMVSDKKCGLKIDYSQFSNVEPKIANWLIDAPMYILDVMKEVAKKVVKNLHPNNSIHDNIYISITKYPLCYPIDDARDIPLNSLVRIGGVVTCRSGVSRQILWSKFDCNKCQFVMGPFLEISYPVVAICPKCQSKGPFTLNSQETVYRNCQKLTVQETIGSVCEHKPPGTVEVVLFNDLIDCVRPGEEIEVTGIYMKEFFFFPKTENYVIVANYVTGKHDFYSTWCRLTEEDLDEILNLANDPRIGERIVKSIAPSIYGHKHFKTAIALAMFGGQEKNVEGKRRLRGDINVLLLGDSGTTSQLLNFVEKTAQKVVYTTCKGDSCAGITAAVYKDPDTEKLTLEAGALVLADKGICLLDEYHEMNDQDRVRIHEVLKQQSIGISEAGIDASMLARCSVIAAANPPGGRYKFSKLRTQSFELSNQVLSQFDIVCVDKGIDGPAAHEIPLAAVLIGDSHFKAQAEVGNLDDKAPINPQEDADLTPNQTDVEIIPQDLLKKYINFAKLRVFPKLRDADLDKHICDYAELQKESSDRAVKHRESIIRMSEAIARMHLRRDVTEEDVDMAIRVLLDSSVSTLGIVIQEALQKEVISARDYNKMVFRLLGPLILGFEGDGMRIFTWPTHNDVKVD